MKVKMCNAIRTFLVNSYAKIDPKYIFNVKWSNICAQLNYSKFFLIFSFDKILFYKIETYLSKAYIDHQTFFLVNFVLYFM